MDEPNILTTAFGPQHGNKPLFKSSRMSDVRFLVDGQTVYGHKQVLGLGSPVFESMFFGELKEQREVIEIEDLTFVGFKNALRYIYGFEIDFDLCELYESYRAADKYLLHGFSEALFNYVRSKLTARNSCLVYEQLVKIGDREAIMLAHVQITIIDNTKEAFESEHFTEIDQETLISLLSLNKLNIVEFDLLAAVSKWVDCEVRRRGLPVNGENRRRVFEPIKGYILFSELSGEKFASCKEMVELIPQEQMAPLLLHMLSKSNQLQVELRTTRKAGSEPCCSRKMCLSVPQRVSIQTLQTTYCGSPANLSLKIRDSAGKDLDLKPKISLHGGYWSFTFDPPFVAKPNEQYNLWITGDEQLTKEELQSKWPQLVSPDSSITFNVSPNSELSGSHFLRTISHFP